ncbi:MAG: hypothetical protein V4692_04040 [Bdellovibrionota bacterium]
MRLLSALALLIFATGCTTTVNLHQFDHAKGGVDNVKGKKIAIISDPAKIQDNHTTASAGQKYAFAGITDGVTGALSDRVTGAAAEVAVFRSTEEATAKKFDIFLYPVVTMRSVDDYFAKGCLVKYELEAKGKDGKMISSDAKELKRNFVLAGQANEKCRSAMTEVFDQVTTSVLTKIR